MNSSQISSSCFTVSGNDGGAKSDSKKFSPLDSSIQRLQRLSLQDSIAVVNTDSDSQPKLQSMQVAKILFTQASVSSTFTDGNRVSDLAQKLASGEISASEIDRIRVVWHQSKVWSLDNRRLRAFKDGFVESVEVELVDLKDPAIKREFWDKKSNKSGKEGGSLRGNGIEAATAQQFNEGIYVFNKRVLNWTFEKIDQPMPSYEKSPLQDRYSNRYNYYKSFENLIFEEARAILQAGIQQAKMDEKYPFQFSLIRLKIAKTAENPTEIKLSILPKSERDVKAGDVFLLEHADYPQLQLIGLANYCPIDQGNPELTFKVVVDRILMMQFPTAFNQDELWKAKTLGSLITLQRMYEVCTTFEGRAQTVLETNILSGKSRLPDLPQVADASEQERFARLNPSQRDAVERFLLLKEGLFLIQGPPGTGKTTTVTQLLGALQERGERVLVCAPSNKAVQILAERFMQEFPDVPMVLVGVEQKLPRDSGLNSIFMDTWYLQKDQFLMTMTEKLWMFQMHKLVPKDLKSLPNQIQKTCQNLERFSQELANFVRELGKYRLSYLDDLEAQTAEFYESLSNYSS
ncbi:MAG: AAA domain-containing protein, partial [Parachlamydiaceae bacterium]